MTQRTEPIGIASGAAVMTAPTILAWEDDPLSTADVRPIERPIPDLETPLLAVAIAGPRPAPGLYPLGTPEFRYWAAAEAVARTVAYWRPLLPPGTAWRTGPALPVRLDAGVGLRAYSDEAGLAFFHDTVGKRTIYTAESPDVVCHETGHAILDAVRPQLCYIAIPEVEAFHEAFADISALLAGLQLLSLRDAVLIETGGRLYRPSRLSRLAEQLGWAIRHRRPGQADPDCLRNAVNDYAYVDPRSLPQCGPAATLARDPHSFSRVFTGAFFGALAGMLSVLAAPGRPSADQLRACSVDAGQLLIDAILAAPPTPDYFAQVAGQLLAADQQRFAGRYGAPLSRALLRRGILSPVAAASR